MARASKVYVVRQTMRAHDDSRLNLRVVRNGDLAHITIDAIEKDGEFRNRLESQLRVLAPDQSVTDMLTDSYDLVVASLPKARRPG